MAATATAVTVDATLNHFIIKGTITVSGSYPGTPGEIVDFSGLVESGVAPDWVEIFELPPAGTSASGLIYGFCPGTTQANGRMQVFLPAPAITPAGSVSAPTITTTTNAGTTTPVYTNGGALTQVAGATGITGVQAPTFTGTAVAAAKAAEAGNVTYASLGAAHIYFRAEFLKFAS